MSEPRSSTTQPACDKVVFGLGARNARQFVSASATTLVKHKSILKSIRVSSRKPSSPSKFRSSVSGLQMQSSTQPTTTSPEIRQSLSFSVSQPSADIPTLLEDLPTVEASSHSIWDGAVLPSTSQPSNLHATAAELIRKRQRDRLLKHSVSVSANMLTSPYSFNKSCASFMSPAKQPTRAQLSSPQKHSKTELSQLDYFQTPSKTPRHVKPIVVSSAPPENQFVVPADLTADNPNFSKKSGGRLEQLAGPLPAELHALRTPMRRLARNLFSSASQKLESLPPTTFERKASKSAEDYKKNNKPTVRRKNDGGNNTQPVAFRDYFEWALCSKMRLTVAKAIPAAVRQQLAKSLTLEQRSQAGLRAVRDYDVLERDAVLSSDEFHSKLAQALTYWAFPLSHTTPDALPHWSFDSKLSSDSATRTRTSAASSASAALNKQNILGFWEAGLNDLWTLTKQNCCPYFYIVSHYWTALVLSPALAGNQVGNNNDESVISAADSTPRSNTKNGKRKRRGSSLVLTESPFSQAMSSEVPASPMILLAKPPKGCINTLRNLNIESQLWRYQTGNAVLVDAGEPTEKSPKKVALNGEMLDKEKNSVARGDVDESSLSQHDESMQRTNGDRYSSNRRKRRRVNMPSVTGQKPKAATRSNKRSRDATPPSAAAASPVNNNIDTNNPNWRTPEQNEKQALNLLRTPDSPFPVNDILKGLKDAGRLKLVDEMAGAYHYRQAAIDTLQLLTISGVEDCDRFISDFLIKQVESLLAPATTAHAYVPPLLLSPSPFLHGAQMQLESSWSESTESNFMCLEVGGGPLMPHVALYLAILWQQLLAGLFATSDSDMDSFDSSAVGTLAFVKHNASAVLSSFFTAPSPTADVETAKLKSAQEMSRAANPLEMETVISLPLNLNTQETDIGRESARNGIDKVVFDCMQKFSERNGAFELETNDPDG